MLSCLRIANFAIIESLEVEFGPGLNVITGETGAGKSIVIDALNLVLGAKATQDVLRTGAESAEVEALFDVSNDEDLRARFEAADFETQDGVIIRRVVSSNGKNKAYINGRLVTTKELSELTAGLADIASQHEHHSLIQPAQHMRYLDAYAKLEEDCAQMKQTFQTLLELRNQIQKVQSLQDKRDEREEWLRFQIHEITELNPHAQEDTQLEEKRKFLRHTEKLHSVAMQAEEALYSKESALCDELSRLSVLVTDAAKIDPMLQEHAQSLDKVSTEVQEVARALGLYARKISADPERLAEIDERLDRLGRLKRKYGGTIEAILAKKTEAEAELATMTHAGDTLKKLQENYAQALSTAQTIAKKLSEKRHRAADKLGQAISKELVSLGMGGARVQVEIQPLEAREETPDVDGARLSALGFDRVEFLIAPNPGQEPKPLRKIASGGELSRSMLAIKRVLTGLRREGFYVFDEVDAGVGGAVAEVIGRKLFDVAKHHQVLCITHLAQIAVYADTHFHVRKEVHRGQTRSDIYKLKPDKETLEEIARMLGGIQITAQTRAAAQDLLRNAKASVN